MQIVKALTKRMKIFHFIKKYENLTQVLTDHKLASLGDAYINFIYSMALSSRKGKPSGAKVKGRVLAEALKKAGLRKYMPSRITRHMLADAAEALVVYGWLHHYITLEETMETLEKTEDLVEGLSQLLRTISDRIKF